MVVAWCTVADVARMLGPELGATFTADPDAQPCCDAANSVAFDKRRAGGHVDDPADGAAAPDPGVARGAALWARALYQHRQTTDGYSSFADLATFTPPSGTMGEIRRLLRISRAQVDTPLVVTPAAAIRRRVITRYL